MTPFARLGIYGFDYIEYAVQSIDKSADLFLKLGFEKSASREIARRKLKSHLLTQNGVAILVSQSTSTEDPIYRFVADHGEGVSNVGFLVQDTLSALETAQERGAVRIATPRAYTRDYGSIETATIQAFGDVRHTFVTRNGNYFLEGFELSFKPMNRGYGLERILSLSAALESGTLPSWKNFYQTVFGLSALDGEGTKLVSPDGMLTLEAQEGSDSNPEVKTFLETCHGPGIRHVALDSKEMRSTIALLQQEKVEFLKMIPEADSISTLPIIGPSFLTITQADSRSIAV